MSTFIKRFGLPVFLVFTYIILLLININKVPLFAGDEKKYWESVQSLMDGHIDSNNHPLLAKTVWLFFVYLGYFFTGTDLPIFWRAGTIVFCIAGIFLFYKILRIYFTKNIALVTSILLAIDPLYFVFGRLMQLDIIALFFILCSFYFLISWQREKDIYFVYRAGLFLGFSLAAKFSAFFVAAAVPVFLFFSERRKKNFRPLKQILLSLLFYLPVTIGFTLGNFIFFVFDHSITDFFKYALAFFNLQDFRAPVVATHQISPPETWFFVPQILSIFRLDFGSTVQSIVMFQNPLSMLSSVFVLLMGAIFLLRRRFKNGYEVGLAFFYFIFLYIPWFIGLHETYYYYVVYLIPFILIIFTSVVLLTKFSKLILGSILTLSVIIFTLYYPLFVGLTVPKNYDTVLYKYSRIKYPPINNIFCQNCYPRK